MIHYRKQKKEELEVLLRTVVELQEMKEKIMSAPSSSSDGLPWREVARALLDHRRVVEGENKSLKARINQHKALLRQMHEWIAHRVSIQTSPDAARTTWQNVTLLGNPSSRVVGKEWITQQLFHNKARMFERHACPAATDEPYMLTDLTFQDDDGIDYVHRGLLILPCPLAILLTVFRNHICDWNLVDAGYPLRTNTIVERTATTALHQVVTPRVHQHMNLLTGECVDNNEDGGFLFVAQQILHDDLFPRTSHTRRRTFWLDTRRRATDGAAQIQYLILESQAMDVDGTPIRLADEARNRGFETHDDDEWTEAAFQAAFRRHSHEMDRRCVAVFQELVLEQVTLDNT
ncbi:Aste57867_14231 [Aphanomyces stellatus]|uniref:Aste57867_14231 protein n=1 Tax=Aphanomyces stellatus TaxID=120398 RepID=A0A485L044_9STRA|nr:hypothetical protein As57867_014180 [Aphanomyces stellatus]VFT91056.1 Aste57867_14231 [Aphanomyces stellatus]